MTKNFLRNCIFHVIYDFTHVHHTLILKRKKRAKTKAQLNVCLLTGVNKKSFSRSICKECGKAFNIHYI